MNIDGVTFAVNQLVPMPGRAGQLQAAGRSLAVISELGDNYSTYHAFLATRLERVGSRPDRRNFQDADAFLEAWAVIHRIVRSEALLRISRAARRDGTPLDFCISPSVPLVDDQDRLVSIEDFEAA